MHDRGGLGRAELENEAKLSSNLTSNAGSGNQRSKELGRGIVIEHYGEVITVGSRNCLP